MAFHSVNLCNSNSNDCMTGCSFRAMNEELLVSAARSGDTSAFNELYKRHSGKVLTRIYRITKNREDAEDFMQAAALRAFLHMKGFEGRASFSTWLTTIATNSALMLLRRRRGTEISIEPMFNDGSRMWEPVDTAETPEARFARGEREAWLLAALRRLPHMLREIIEMQQSEEYSTAQIAEEIGISLSAAKSRLMQARKTLRRLSQARVTADANQIRPANLKPA